MLAVDLGRGTAIDVDHLEQLGLSHDSIIQSNGNSAAAKFSVIIDRLDVDNPSLYDAINHPLSTEAKIAISRAIIHWQSLASRSVRSTAFEGQYPRILHILKCVLLKPDDIFGDDYSKYGSQTLGLNLSHIILKEAKDKDDSIAPLLYRQLIAMMVELLDGKIVLIEKSEYGNQAASVRTESIRALVRCIPDKGMEQYIFRCSLLSIIPTHLSFLLVHDSADLKSAVAIFLGMMKVAVDAPTLRGELSQKLTALCIDDLNDDARFQHLLGDRVADVLHAIKSGHSELRHLVVRNKALFSAQSKTIEQHLPHMIDALGFDELEHLIIELSEKEPKKLLQSLPVFLAKLGEVAMKHKFLLMGVFLSVALVIGAVYIVPLLGGIGAVCCITPQLFVPFFKLLTTVASNEETAVQCLTFIARIAKSGLCSTVADKHALLEAVNIVKDRMQHSNIFSEETIAALQSMADANSATFQNIKKWNEGKSAQRGDHKKYSTTAGGQQPYSNSFVSTIMSLSPIRSRNIGVKSPVVSPSPHSQNISLLESSLGSPTSTDVNNTARNLFAEDKASEANDVTFAEFVAKQKLNDTKGDNAMLDPDSIDFNIAVSSPSTEVRSVAAADTAHNKTPNKTFILFPFRSPNRFKSNSVSPSTPLIGSTTKTIEVKRQRDEAMTKDLLELREKVKQLDLKLS